MMIRRTIAFFAAVILSMGVMSGCATSSPVTATTQNAEVFENANPAPAPIGPADTEPPVETNPALYVSDVVIDTTGFSHPIVLTAWEIQGSGENRSIFATLSLRGADWVDFIRQAGVDTTYPPFSVQVAGDTATSLYSIDKLNTEVLAHHQGRGLKSIDVREVQIFWTVEAR